MQVLGLIPGARRPHRLRSALSWRGCMSNSSWETASDTDTPMAQRQAYTQAQKRRHGACDLQLQVESNNCTRIGNTWRATSNRSPSMLPVPSANPSTLTMVRLFSNHCSSRQMQGSPKSTQRYPSNSVISDARFAQCSTRSSCTIF